MALYSDSEKREIIMDYYMKPRRKVAENFDSKNLKTYYHHSENCVDEITLIALEDKNDYIFKATGCAVFLAATEIFLEEAAKNDFNKNKELGIAFEKLVQQEEMNQDELEIIGKLAIFSNVKKHLNRVECALMITKTFQKI